MKRSEVKDETPFGYAHAEIRTQVLVICGPMRYQLDHGGYGIFSRSCAESDITWGNYSLWLKLCKCLYCVSPDLLSSKLSITEWLYHWSIHILNCVHWEGMFLSILRKQFKVRIFNFFVYVPSREVFDAVLEKISTLQKFSSWKLTLYEMFSVSADKVSTVWVWSILSHTNNTWSDIR